MRSVHWRERMHFAEPARVEGEDWPALSVVAGGPLHRWLMQFHMHSPEMSVAWRMLAIAVAVTWLPLAVLSMIPGQLAEGAMPFWQDMEVHARFLVSLPALLLAERVVHVRLRGCAREFLNRGIVPPEGVEGFHRAVDRAVKWRDSAWPELITLAIVVLLAQLAWRGMGDHPAAWFGSPTAAGGYQFTPAGYWYALVSMTIYRFILLRWYFRLALWVLFLWRVSRLPLRLVASHPDQCGGMGFLAYSSLAFAPVLFAQGAIFGAMIGNHVVHEGGTLQDYQVPAGIAVAVVFLCNLLPVLVFIPDLVRAKRAGREAYGLLAARYTWAFEDKWIRRPAPPEELLGTADLQSLADLINSYNTVASLRVVPINKTVALQLLLALVIPMLPLVFVVVPPREVLGMIVKFLF